VVEAEDSVFEERIDTDCTIATGIRKLFQIPIMVLDVEINFFEAILFTLGIDASRLFTRIARRSSGEHALVDRSLSVALRS